MNPDTALAKARTAGKIQIGAAAALLVSSFVPFVSFGGLININLPALLVAYVIALAAVVGGLGTMAVSGRVTALLIFGSWIVAVWLALNAILVVVVFAGQGDSFVSASPGPGALMAFAAAAAEVIGVVVLARSHAHELRNLAGPRVVSNQIVMSSDRAYWFDGNFWHDARIEALPGAPISPDGAAWWDGFSWRGVLLPPAPPVA